MGADLGCCAAGEAVGRQGQVLVVTEPLQHQGESRWTRWKLQNHGCPLSTFEGVSGSETARRCKSALATPIDARHYTRLIPRIRSPATGGEGHYDRRARCVSRLEVPSKAMAVILIEVKNLCVSLRFFVAMLLRMTFTKGLVEGRRRYGCLRARSAVDRLACAKRRCCVHPVRLE